MAQKLTFEAGITGPEGHSLSRPAYIEVGFAPCLQPHMLCLLHMLGKAAPGPAPNGSYQRRPSLCVSPSREDMSAFAESVQTAATALIFIM